MTEQFNEVAKEAKIGDIVIARLKDGYTQVVSVQEISKHAIFGDSFLLNKAGKVFTITLNNGCISGTFEDYLSLTLVARQPLDKPEPTLAGQMISEVPAPSTEVS